MVLMVLLQYARTGNSLGYVLDSSRLVSIRTLYAWSMSQYLMELMRNGSRNRTSWTYVEDISGLARGTPKDISGYILKILYPKLSGISQPTMDTQANPYARSMPYAVIYISKLNPRTGGENNQVTRSVTPSSSSPSSDGPQPFRNRNHLHLQYRHKPALVHRAANTNKFLFYRPKTKLLPLTLGNKEGLCPFAKKGETILQRLDVLSLLLVLYLLSL